MAEPEPISKSEVTPEFVEEITEAYKKIPNGKESSEQDQPTPDKEGIVEDDPQDQGSDDQTEQADHKKDEGEGDEKKDASARQDDDDKDQDQDKDQGQDFIDERLVNAGRRAKFSDENIQDLASNHPEVLETLAGLQDKISAEMGERGRKQQPDKTAEDDGGQPKDQDDYQPLALAGIEEMVDGDFKKSILDPIIARLNAMGQENHDLKKANEAALTETQDAENERLADMADQYFDALNTADMGKSGTLNQAQFNTRYEAIVSAQGIRAAHNQHFSDKPITLETALKRLYRGQQQPDEKAGRDHTQAYEQQGRLMTQKPRGTRKTQRRFKTEKEAAVAAVYDYLEKTG